MSTTTQSSTQNTYQGISNTTRRTTRQQGVVQKTYTAVGTVVQGDPQELKQTIDQTSGAGTLVLISGILMLVMISSVIETGTFFGILLPSDLILSISVIAFISLGKWWMVLLITLASITFTIVGDMLGYATGKKLGSTLYDKEDTRYFKKKYFLDAQEAFIKRGDTMLYIGRYLSIGGFLPTLCGVMGMDQKKFFHLSVTSAAIRKLSLVVPMSLLMAIFPSIKTGFLLVLIFTLPEIIGWIVLFFPKAQEYAHRLEGAKAQIEAIRNDMRHIVGQVGGIVEVLKQEPGQTQQIQTEIPVQTTPTPIPKTASSLETPIQTKL